MKKLILSVFAAGILLSACNQSAKTTKTTDSAASQSADASSSATSSSSMVATQTNVPVMNFEKSSYDFGKITRGTKVTYSFKFTNTGKSPLIITNAVASCGCTTPNWPKTPVTPGQSGQITVVFNSTGKIGLQDKMVTITANTKPAQTVVHLVGEVLEKK